MMFGVCRKACSSHSLDHQDVPLLRRKVVNMKLFVGSEGGLLAGTATLVQCEN